MKRATRITSIALAMTAMTVCAAAASPSSALVLKANGHVVPPGTRTLGELEIGGFCGRFSFTGKLKVNSSAVDSIGVRATLSRIACEGGPAIDARIKTVKATSAGELILLGRVRYASGSVEPQHCVWEMSELKGTFAIPGPVEASLYGVGSLNSRESDAGCPAQEEFNGHTSLTKAKTHVVFDAEA
jgi:hypothetical protein